MRKLFEIVLWFIVSLPACLLYTDNTADWGDDWAGYYAEASHVAHGLPIGHTHYRFFDYNDHYAPPCYPAGYPLLLAPVVAQTGLNMEALGWYMSLWTGLWIALSATFIRRRLGIAAAICGTGIFLLSPYMLETKGRLWSDIPFSFFVLAALWMYQSRSRPLYAIVSGLCMGIAIAIRSAGAVVLLAVCIDAGLAYAAERRRPSLWPLLTIMSCAALAILAVRLLHPVPSDSYYARQLGTATWGSIAANAHTYLLSFDHYIAGGSAMQTSEVHTITWLMLAGIITGMVTWRQERLPALTIVLMLALIIIFPDTQDMRYMIPLLPLMALYMLAALRALHSRVGHIAHLAPVLLLVWTGLLHADQYRTLWHRRHSPHTYGPFTAASQKGLAEVRAMVPGRCLILCRWPRVAGLLTDRDCCVIPEGDLAHQLTSLSMARPDYLLSIEERDAEMTDRIAAAHGDSIVYNANGFRLYRCRPWP